MLYLAQINWGDVPTWFGAAGAIGAFIVCYLLLRGELLKRSEEAERRRTYTARRTAACTDGSRLIVQNSGDEPVFDLVAYVGPMGTDFHDPEHAGRFLELVIGTVGPGARIEEDLDEAPSCGHFPDIPEVAVEFTDCNETHWRREPRGRLKSINSRRPYD